jgi:hypothetical protein
MSNTWTQANYKTKEYRKMCAWATNKLYATVDEDLHPIIIKNEGNLVNALNALGVACGEKSVIMVCDKLFHLINLTYEPGTSLAQHISNFRRHYTALTTSLASQKEFMTVSTGMAAAFLLRSLYKDESLSGLVQNLYDLDPLTLEKVYDRLSAEDGRKESHSTESAYSLSQTKKKETPINNPLSTNPYRGASSSRSRGNRQSRGNLRGVVPTRPAPKNQDSNDQFARRFRQQMKLYVEGQANMVQEDDHYDEDYDEVEAVDYDDDDPEDTGFMVSDELNVNVDSPGDNKSTLVFDSGATKTTLCNYNLLIDPKPILKAMNTYSGQISITHVGKMNLGGTIIYPVYYAPNGPRNLVSSSQLEDHGLSIYFKSRLILIRKGATIVYRFPRVGNLYMGQISEVKTANWIMAITDPSPETDYHIALGHPSDEYLRQFLKLHSITPTNPGQLAKNCDICKSCKLKRSPHSNPLPTTD